MQMESLSSEEWGFCGLFCCKEHIFWFGAATTARGGVEIPVSGAEVGFFCEAERFGGTINRFWCAF